MEHPETYLVTAENGPRPAGPPDRCFYCDRGLGEPHKPDCVCRKRTVVVRAIIEYTINVPADESPESIEFLRNESSWCSSNILDELSAIETVDSTDGGVNCLCRFTRFEYVREASAEDEASVFGSVGLLAPPEQPEDEGN